jgi:predicted aspartyl protease
MIIKVPVLYEGSLGDATLISLFDTGSTYSLIREDEAELLGRFEELPNPKEFETASAGHFVKVTQRVSLDFTIDDIVLSDEFLVVPTLSEQAIIGVTTMQKWRIKLNFDTDKVEVDPKVAKFILKDMKYKK